MVADTVFDPAAAELSVPVVTPSASVGPLGCVSVLPKPVAVTMTVAPGIGLPNPSLAVTVIVEVPVPAAIGDVALTVDCAADTPPAFTTTVAVWVIAIASIVADTVFEPAVVELRVPVATPLASVVPTGCVSVFPGVGVAVRVTVAPLIGLPLASRAVTVIVELPLPAVIGDVALTVDCAAETAPTFTTTVAVWVIATVLIVADTVFEPAAVELRVPVICPLAPVVPTGCVTVFPKPVALRMTVAPAIGLPKASRAVTVTVEVPVPAVIGDVAARLDCAPETVLAATTTVAVCVTPTALMVADTVFDSGTTELSVPVATPLAFVLALGCVSVFPKPVADNATVAPGIGLPNPSLAVTVIVEVPVPAAIGDVAVSVDWAAETAPAFTTTVAGCVMATASLVAETVFDSATVDDSVPVATPLAFVVPIGCVSVFPVVGVAASTTVAPWIGLPFTSFAVCVIATALIVAEIVLDSATVDPSVPVATPLASVVVPGWLRVLPFPVVANTTVAP